MKDDYQKPLKKSTLFFLPNPVPFNGQSYQKQKGPGTSAQSLFRLRKKFSKDSFISYLTKFDDVELFQKLHLQIYASQFMTSQINPLSFVLLYLESGKEGKKLQKFEYLENEKSFFD